MHTQPATRRQQPDMLDGVLVQQACAGDQEAFAILVDRYSAPLIRLASRLLGDDHLVDDVLQHVFLQLHRSLPTLRTDTSLKAWLYQVARHRCVDELRRQRPISFSMVASVEDEDELPPFALLPDPSPLPEELAELHEIQHYLQQAIQALPPRLRSVVLLRYAAQLSFSEIGQRLGISEATAKVYFHRARPLLRASLEVQLEDTPGSPEKV